MAKLQPKASPASQPRGPLPVGSAYGKNAGANPIAVWEAKMEDDRRGVPAAAGPTGMLAPTAADHGSLD